MKKNIISLDIVIILVNFFFVWFSIRFPCEVRVRSVPLTPCRRKKRKDEESESPKRVSTSAAKQDKRTEQNNDAQVQSSQVRKDTNAVVIFRAVHENLFILFCGHA